MMAATGDAPLGPGPTAMMAATGDAPLGPGPSAPRIVSLLPSATEMLVLLGAHLVGRSHECDWPQEIAASVPALTGAFNKFEDSLQMHNAVASTMQQGKGLYWLDTAGLAAAAPDIVVTQSLCSVCAVDTDVVRASLAGLHPPPRIVDTNPMNLYDVIRDVAVLGEAVGATQAGLEVAAALQARVDAALRRARELAAAREAVEEEAAAAGADGAGGAEGGAAAAPAWRARPRVVFLEWACPLFPGGHWTPQMLTMAGADCPINPPTRPGGGAAPSAELPPSAVVAADPDLLLVAPCGLDLAVTRREVEAHLAGQDWWQGLRAVRGGRVALVDGNQHFNRPGPRLVDALEWLVGWVHNSALDAAAAAGGAVAALAAARLSRVELDPGFPWEALAAEEQLGAGVVAEVDVGAAEHIRCCDATGADQPRVRPLAPANGSSSGSSNAAGVRATVPSPASARSCCTPAGCAPCPAPQAAPSRGPSREVGGAEADAAAGAAAPQSGCNGGCGAQQAQQRQGAADPWVPPAAPWTAAAGLSTDIEDVHAAACEAGRSTYLDPATGFTVFTEVGLQKRSDCCGNRCRHCPWAHYKLVGRPRINSLRAAALLQPSPGSRAARVRVGQAGQAGGGGAGQVGLGAQGAQQEGGAKQQQGAVSRWWPGSWRRGSSGGQVGPGAGAAGGGGAAAEALEGATLVAYEPGDATPAVVKQLLRERKAGGLQQQRIALLVGFSAASGATWGDPRPATAAAATARQAAARSEAATLYGAMDLSLEYDIDLVAVPLQVPAPHSRTPGWNQDPRSCAAALEYVVRTASGLLKSPVGRVVSPSGPTPQLFAPGTCGCVEGGWEAVVRAARQ